MFSNMLSSAFDGFGGETEDCGPLPGPLIDGYGGKGLISAPAERAGQPGRLLRARPSRRSQAKPRTRSRQRVPADGGVHIIQEEAVGARKGHTLGTRRLLSPLSSAREKCARDSVSR